MFSLVHLRGVDQSGGQGTFAAVLKGAGCLKVLSMPIKRQTGACLNLENAVDRFKFAGNPDVS
jgi:hypothetical protein